MKARFAGFGASANRVNAALALGVFLALLATGSASAALATPEQKKACTPDVYRLCPGESGRLPLACGGRRPASATLAGQCSSRDSLMRAC
jgi:hypothetical protein